MRSVVVTGARPEIGMGAHPEHGVGIHLHRMVSMHAIQAYLVLRQVMGRRRFLILAGPDRLLPLPCLLGTTFFAQKCGFLDTGGEQEAKDVLLRRTHPEIRTRVGHGVHSHAKVLSPRRDG